MFPDYSNEELVQIMMHKAKSMGLHVSEDVARLVVRKDLEKQRAKPNFGNGGAVSNMLERGKESWMRRLANEEPGSGSKSDGRLVLVENDLMKSRKKPAQDSEFLLELNAMIGLEDVKKSVRALMQLAEHNIAAEESNEPIIDIILHRMFLGNPGTGKTSVAKVYGKLLKEMGLLSNGEVIVVGASTLTGNAVGTTATKVNELLNRAEGKVLVIDEAYVLSKSQYGLEALDVLVERVQGSPEEDFAVILCGYENEMKTMLREGNPGLARRFRFEDAFMFPDYSNEELVQIMMHKAKSMGLHVSEDVARSVVRKDLEKQRAKPNFGNGGAVSNMLERGKESWMRRLANEEPGSGSKLDGMLVLSDEDMLPLAIRSGIKSSLDDLYNVDDVVFHIDNLRKQVLASNKQHKDAKLCLKHYLFTGPPGTGKTTVARVFGELFHELGLLSNRSVVEVKAMDLIAQYVGQTAPIVDAKMTEARGGILFIDEAYGLSPSRSQYAKDAIEALLANVTGKDYEGNLVIILAGYEHDIDDLLSSNTGLYRRFTERISFRAWNAIQSREFLKILCAEDEIEIHDELLELSERYFQDLIEREGWGSAGDVKTIFQKFLFSRNTRCDDDGTVEGPFMMEDIHFAFEQILSQRKIGLSQVKMDDVFKRSTETSLSNHFPQFASLQATNASQDQTSCTNSESHAQSTNTILSEDFDDNCNAGLIEEFVIPQECECIQTQSEHENYAFDPSASYSEPSAGQNDAGEDEDLKVLLEQACAELGYSIIFLVDFLRSGEYPTELLDSLQRKSRSKDKIHLKNKIEPQRLVMLKKVEEALRIITLEEKRLRTIEEERRRMVIQNRLRELGRCPMNFEWIKVDGGYRCAGGSHFVTESLVNYI